MARVHEQVFAWVAIVVVVVSVCALSAAVVIQQIATNNQSNANAQNAANNTGALSCTDSSTSEPTFAAPAKYTAAGDVTALQTTDLGVGSGQTAKQGDCLIVKYYGTLANDGTEFDQNFTNPTAFAFVLGQGQVIQGWDQGLIGMKVGGERRLVIPASLAYGNTSTGSIPANSALVFDVRLLRIQAK